MRFVSAMFETYTYVAYNPSPKSRLHTLATEENGKYELIITVLYFSFDFSDSKYSN